MDDPGETQRLQPALLDRLTDDAPQELKEKRSERVIDVHRLRDIVQRDLAWLLNTNSHETLIDIKAFPNIAKSVINYGVREVAGETATADRAEEIRKMMHQAIIRFEPRIDADTLEVAIRVEEKDSQSVIAYDIHADMWAQPLPLELYLRSEVNLATGQLKLERGRN